MNFDCPEFIKLPDDEKCDRIMEKVALMDSQIELTSEKLSLLIAQRDRLLEKFNISAKSVGLDQITEPAKIEAEILDNISTKIESKD